MNKAGSLLRFAAISAFGGIIEYLDQPCAVKKDTTPSKDFNSDVDFTICLSEGRKIFPEAKSPNVLKSGATI